VGVYGVSVAVSSSPTEDFFEDYAICIMNCPKVELSGFWSDPSAYVTATVTGPGGTSVFQFGAAVISIEAGCKRCLCPCNCTYLTEANPCVPPSLLVEIFDCVDIEGSIPSSIDPDGSVLAAMQDFFAGLPAVVLPFAMFLNGGAYYEAEIVPEGRSYTQVIDGQTVTRNPKLLFRVTLKCDTIAPLETTDNGGSYLIEIRGPSHGATPNANDLRMYIGAIDPVAGHYLNGITFTYTNAQIGEAVALPTQSLYTLCSGGSKEDVYDASSENFSAYPISGKLYRSDLSDSYGIFFATAKIRITAP
jgi:hypothetical protein